jgi:hypothetical protein
MENEIKHSIDFINKKVGNKNNFSVPTNYFDHLEDDISLKISEKSFKKNNAFKIPETYFNTIEDNILTTISSQEKKTKVISFKQRLLKLIPYAAAASIALFIGLNSFVFNTNDILTFDMVSDDDIEYWLDENTISTSEIGIILEDEISDENAFYFTKLEDESIEDYINSIDNTSLLNELN